MGYFMYFTWYTGYNGITYNIKKSIAQADELAGMDEDSDAHAFLASFASLNEWQLLFSQNMFRQEFFHNILSRLEVIQMPSIRLSPCTDAH